VKEDLPSPRTDRVATAARLLLEKGADALNHRKTLLSPEQLSVRIIPKPDAHPRLITMADFIYFSCGAKPELGQRD